MAGLSVLSGNLLFANTASAAAVSLVLDMALEELFTPYIDKYIDKEQKSLTELYASYLIKFTRWHRQNTKARGGTAAGSGQGGPGSMFDRMVNQITTAAQNSNAASAVQQEGARGLKHLMKLGGISLSDKQRRDSTDSLHSLSQSTGGNADQRNSPGTGTSQAQQTDMHIPLVVTEKDGEISLEVAERMLRWHAEAVGRMIELSPPPEACVHSLAAPQLPHSKLTDYWLSTLQFQKRDRSVADPGGQLWARISRDCARHVSAGLALVSGSRLSALETDAFSPRRANSHIAMWEGRTEPPINVMRVVRETDLTVQLWQRYVSTALMPLAGSSLATRREMTGLNSQTLGRIESKVNELVQRCTDGQYCRGRRACIGTCCIILTTLLM